MDNITTKIKVWDAPVRVFHWLMVLSFAGAYLSAESERWRLLHVTLGYTFGGLVAFRLVWGLVGTRYARFANFVRGPQAVLTYLRSLRKGQPQHHAFINIRRRARERSLDGVHDVQPRIYSGRRYDCGRLQALSTSFQSLPSCH